MLAQEEQKRTLPHTRTLVLKTDYSGYFSVSIKSCRQLDKPNPLPVGLAVTSSETATFTVAKRQSAPRGSRGLTSYAKRLLVGGVNLLEQRHGKNNLVFHSATLPSDDPVIKLETLRRSKEILKYWRKVLSRLLERYGLPHDDIVIVLELQERQAIHFHTVFVNRYRRGRYTLSLEQLDRAWYQALTAIVPALKTADFSKSCRTERVKKSAGRYLAKYLSKGGVSGFNFSITWYSIGNALKNQFKALAKTVIRSITKDFDFFDLAHTLANSKVGWKLEFYALEGTSIRCLFGYFDHKKLDFVEFLSYLVDKVSFPISWSNLAIP